MRSKVLKVVPILLILSATAAVAQTGGRINGTVSRDNGSGIGGVTVVVSELGLVEITSDTGGFSFHGIPGGSYTLTYSLGDNAASSAIEVIAGQAVTVEQQVDWNVSYAETIVVYSASRRRERIVDAPSAVTVISADEIEQQASDGQLPKVLEFSPGISVTQSGINDFNLNTRGFNSSLNRRVQVLVDGRDPSVPFLGSTEWGYLAMQEGIANMEMVRGPSSALYGANAFNGVLNLTTKNPKDYQGGSFTLAGGELSTIRGDLAWATELGNEWYFRVNGSYTEGEGFTQDRRRTTEYAGLPREASFCPGSAGCAADTNDYDTTQADLRVDKHFGKSVLSLEAGTYEAQGYAVVTGIGRVDANDVDRDYFRFNLSSIHFNIHGYHNTRKSPDQLALASGGRIFLDTENQKIEVQGNGDFNEGKIRLVGGGSYIETDIDTANNAGFQTLTFAPVASDQQAVFGQADFQLSDNLKLVVAGRYDESTLHKSQVSPKAALVWSINSSNTLRFSYNEAFQVANYSEFFLDAPTVVPGTTLSALDLRAVEGLCGLLGVSCGFGSPTRVRALGNKDLTVEEITSFEVGYSGILNSKAFLTIDYYANELDNFITDLAANPFGSVNPNFGPYTLPDGSPAPALVLATLRGALGPLVAFLSNNVDGTPIFALASYTNAGAVDTQGIDVGLNVYASPQWKVDFAYSWFDFDIKDSGGASPDSLVPNAPENSFSTGLTYTGDRASAGLKYRWVDSFAWSAGAFAGPVPSYNLVNLSFGYDINDRVSLGLNISNALDETHYQSFGGDLVGRRSVANVKFRW